jgi:hypothetical protein
VADLHVVRAALIEVEGTPGFASMKAAALLYLIGRSYSDQGRHEAALDAYGRMLLEVRRKAIGEEQLGFANLGSINAGCERSAAPHNSMTCRGT